MTWILTCGWKWGVAVLAPLGMLRGEGGPMIQPVPPIWPLADRPPQRPPPPVRQPPAPPPTFADILARELR